MTLAIDSTNCIAGQYASMAVFSDVFVQDLLAGNDPRELQEITKGQCGGSSGDDATFRHTVMPKRLCTTTDSHEILTCITAQRIEFKQSIFSGNAFN